MRGAGAAAAAVRGPLRGGWAPWVALGTLLPHVVAAATWVGGLVAVVWAERRAPVAAAGMLGRFSPLALGCAVVVVVTGVVNALLRVDVATLLDTGYGVLVALKAVALVVLVGCGWLHRRRTLHRLDGTAGSRPFLALAGFELVVMVVTFAIVTALAQSPYD